MHAAARVILMFIANVAAVLIAAYFVPDFQITADVQKLLPLVLGLTAANILLRPLLKTILSPLILITLGLFTVAINAGIIAIIDFYSDSLTIDNLQALFYATVIISAVNMIVHHAALFLYRRPELS